ncbi:hypothetical protein H4219_000773 [Mycoemilia scoparia]|uniref:Nicotinamide-nucleotide adenylyltransferase n=1 Tax=Mycoemilia scoparia TaxID=417184 RepID=A0A9W8A2N0_9FUNG|nr:hypothetical protein H4219_000773 [Mycoemilia scoparia]
MTSSISSLEAAVSRFAQNCNATSSFLLKLFWENNDGRFLASINDHISNSGTAANIAVLDSSFNPPHACHKAYLELITRRPLVPLSRVLDHQTSETDNSGGDSPLRVDGKLILLSSANCDKKPSGASLVQRLGMMEILGKELVVDGDGSSSVATGLCNAPRFVDKAIVLYRFFSRIPFAEDRVPNGPTTKVVLYFMMGWDTLIRLFDPKYYDAFPEDLEPFFSYGGRIVYARRGGFDDSDVSDFLAKRIPMEFQKYIFEIELPRELAAISSTRAREEAGVLGRSKEYEAMVPKSIRDFISSQQIYKKV